MRNHIGDFSWEYKMKKSSVLQDELAEVKFELSSLFVIRITFIP